MSGSKPMTVAQLRARLADFPDDAPVYSFYDGTVVPVILVTMRNATGNAARDCDVNVFIEYDSW